MKYIKSVMLTMLFTCIASAQANIPVINAINLDFNNFFLNYENSRSDDSWYYTETSIVVTASSSLKNSGGNTYDPGNAHDFKLDTAWVEGKPDYGIGESITFTVMLSPGVYDYLILNSFKIANGYTKNKKLWLANSRVKAMKMLVNNKTYAEINLNDFYGFQKVEFSNIKIQRNKEIIIKFIIKDVYPGEKYSDTSISQLEFDGGGYYD